MGAASSWLLSDVVTQGRNHVKIGLRPRHRHVQQAAFMVQPTVLLRTSGAREISPELVNVFNARNKTSGTLYALYLACEELPMFNYDAMFSIVPGREQWENANDAYLESLSQDAALVLSAADNLLALKITAEKSALTDSLTQARMMLDVTDVREFMALLCRVGRPGFEKTLTYGCVFYDLLAQIQNQALRLAEFRSGGLYDFLQKPPIEAADPEPYASNAGMDAARSFASLARLSLDTMKGAAKELASMMERNIAAMTITTVRISNTARGKMEDLLRASS